MSQNVHNAINLIETSTTTTTTTTSSKDLKSTLPGDNERGNNFNNNNNNPIYQRISSTSSCGDENNISSNGAISDIPKIVGKLGRFDSNNYFQFQRNGIISDKLTRDNTTHVNEAMDQ